MISVSWARLSSAASSTLVMSLSIRSSWVRLTSCPSQEAETTWRKLCPRESLDRPGSPARDAVPRVRMLL